MTVTPATSQSDIQTNSNETLHTVAMHVNVAPSHTIEHDTLPDNTLCNDTCLSNKTDIMQNAKYEIADLAYINVHIDGLSFPVKALHDSGAMISVIHPRVIQDLSSYIPREGKIKIRGLFGEPGDADVVTLFINVPNRFDDSDHSIPVVMAMTPEVNNDLILTDPVVQALLSSEQNDTKLSTPSELLVHNDVITDTSLSDDTDTTDTEDESNSTPTDEQDSNRTLNTAQLCQEQKQDEMMSGPRMWAWVQIPLLTPICEVFRMTYCERIPRRPI